MVLEPWLARSPGGRLLCVAAAVQGGTSATRDSWLPPAPKDVPVDMCMGVNGSINVKSDEQGGWIRAQSGIWMTPITLWENLVPHRLSFDLQTQSCMLALHYPPPPPEMAPWYCFVQQLDPCASGELFKMVDSR